MADYTAAQLYGTGSIIDFEMNDSTTFRLNKTSTQHVYITFDKIDGDPKDSPLGDHAGFVFFDDNGVKLHLAYSPTNWAYSFPKGTHDTGTFVMAVENTWVVPESTVRVRGLGLCNGAVIDNSTVVLTIGGGTTPGLIPNTIPNTIGSA